MANRKEDRVTDPVTDADNTPQSDNPDPAADAEKKTEAETQQKEAPPSPDSNGNKVRIKCESLKGKSVVVGKDTVQVDENGILEVGEDQANRLLTIPGYEKA